MQSNVSESVHRDCTVVDISVRGLAYQNLIDGGVTGSIVTVNSYANADMNETLTSIMSYIQAVSCRPDILTIADAPEDVARAKAEHRVAYMFHMQGITEIGSSLHWIEILGRLGVRLMALTYNNRNQFGSGAGEREDSGLTYLGRQALREMQRAGIVVDLSHLGFRTAQEALETTSGPVVISHSCPHALVPNGRNAHTELMQGVAARGGMMGIPVYAPLMDTGDGTFPTIETMLDHLDHAVDVMGIDHVGIGTDHAEMTDVGWEYYVSRHCEMMPTSYTQPPHSRDAKFHSVEGFGSAADMPKLTAGLVARGYSNDDVRKIMGGNMMRVLNEVWGGHRRALRLLGS